MIEFLGNESILFKNKYLVIADLHLGIEKELLAKGINIPPQTDILIKKIRKIVENTNAKYLIILGDLKHNVPNVSYMEIKEIPIFIDRISNYFNKIIITKGNHDGDLEKILKNSKNTRKVDIVKALKIKNVVFTHGHLKPKIKGKLYIIGHHHFAIKIRTSINEIIHKKVFVLGKTKDYKVLILPSFSDLPGYWDVEEFHGPIAKNINKYYVLSLEGYILYEKQIVR